MRRNNAKQEIKQKQATMIHDVPVLFDFRLQYSCSTIETTLIRDRVEGVPSTLVVVTDIGFFRMAVSEKMD